MSRGKLSSRIMSTETLSMEKLSNFCGLFRSIAIHKISICRKLIQIRGVGLDGRSMTNSVSAAL